MNNLRDVLITITLFYVVVTLTLIFKSISTYEFIKYEKVRAAQLVFLGLSFMQSALTFVVEISDVLNYKSLDFAQYFRYVSWLITTPLVLYTYYQLAKVNGYKGDFTIIIFANLVMFLSIIISEAVFKSGPIAKALDIVSFIAYGIIFWKIIEIRSFFKSKGLYKMARLGLFFLVSWPLYLIGVLLEGDLKYIAYTISDFINKFLYGLALNSVIDV
jgi:hypothetical protein